MLLLRIGIEEVKVCQGCHVLLEGRSTAPTLVIIHLFVRPGWRLQTFTGHSLFFPEPSPGRFS